MYIVHYMEGVVLLSSLLLPTTTTILLAQCPPADSTDVSDSRASSSPAGTGVHLGQEGQGDQRLQGGWGGGLKKWVPWELFNKNNFYSVFVDTMECFLWECFPFQTVNFAFTMSTSHEEWLAFKLVNHVALTGVWHHHESPWHHNQV